MDHDFLGQCYKSNLGLGPPSGCHNILQTHAAGSCLGIAYNHPQAEATSSFILLNTSFQREELLLIMPDAGPGPSFVTHTRHLRDMPASSSSLGESLAPFSSRALLLAFKNSLDFAPQQTLPVVQPIPTSVGEERKGHASSLRHMLPPLKYPIEPLHYPPTFRPKRGRPANATSRVT